MLSVTWVCCSGVADTAPAELISAPAPSSPPSTLSANLHPFQASAHRSKALRQGTESMRPHRTEPSKMIVTFHVTVDGKPYQQEPEIPDEVPTPVSVPSSGGSVIFPEVEASTVPRTPKKFPWTLAPGSSGYEWTRGDGDKKEFWRISVFFRRLDRDTYAFQDICVNTNYLRNFNPNDGKFKNVYNNWILQFARR
jgi:hypothetical protein